MTSQTPSLSGSIQPSVAVLYAGGGTGGHIYPNIAIREHLASLIGDHPSSFFVSDRPIDAQILTAAMLPFIASRAKPFGIRPGLLWRWWSNWRPAVHAARLAIRQLREKAPRVVVCSTGGFVSAAAAKAARLEHAPLLMVNLDAVPGKANRLIARRATRVVTAATITAGSLSWPTIPPIVRREALPPGDPTSCRLALGLPADRPVLLITGASQGAASINNAMRLFAESHPAPLAGWSILHQTGPGDLTSLSSAYARAGLPAIVTPFVSGMGRWWGAANLCVGRCGAGIVAEAWASRIPSIFLPYPFHKDQHQRANAEPLARVGAACIHTDLVEPAATLVTLAPTLAALLTDPQRRSAMTNAFAALGNPDGAARAASLLADIARGE